MLLYQLEHPSLFSTTGIEVVRVVSGYRDLDTLFDEQE